MKKSILIILFMIFLLVATYPVYAGGSSKSITTTGRVVEGHIDIQAVIIWKGTDGDAVTFYDGTGSSRIKLFKIGGGSGTQHSYIHLGDLEVYDSLWCETTWSGTGWGNPEIWGILK